MTPEWFYHRDGRPFGPVTAADLRSLARTGALRPGDLVWKAGMVEWVPAERVKGLFPVPPAPQETTPHARRQRERAARRDPAPEAPDNPFDFGTGHRGDGGPAGGPGPVADGGDEVDFKDLNEGALDRLYERFGLWRFGVVYLAVVLSSVLFLGLLALVGSKEKPPPWDGLLVLEVVFVAFAGVAVCLLPLAAGHVWRDRSERIGRWGSRELRIYVPATPLGWVGYFFAVWVSAGCCLFLLVAAFAALAAGSTRVCPYCRSSVSSLLSTCPHCRMNLP